MSEVKLSIDGGRLSVNLYDLVESLSDEARATLIDSLACHGQVITEVMNQVIDGYTTQGSYSATSFGGNPDATYGLDGARMRIAKASSEIAAKEIERLGDELKRTKARIDEGWTAYHNLMQERSRWS